MKSSRLPLSACAILLLAMAYCAVHGLVTAEWIQTPFPNEYREWANVEAARAVLSGKLYGTEAGDGIYLYGFVYPLLCHCAGQMSDGEWLTVARVVTYTMTLLTALLGMLVVYRHSRSVVAACLAFVLLLTTGWYNVTGVAHPATTGVFLLLLTLCLSSIRGGWCWCALTTVLCFYTKAYFVAVFFPVFHCLWLRARRQAWLYAAVCLLLGLLSVVAVRQVYPAFFAFHVVHHLHAASRSWLHLLTQLAVLSALFFPLGWMAVHRCCREGGLRRLDVYGWSACLLFIIWLRLGMHTGASYTYAYQLWWPPLCVYALSVRPFPPGKWPYWPVWLTLAISLYGAGAYLNLPLHASATADNRGQLPDAFLRQYPPEAVACFSPAMAVYADGRGIPLYNNGQTQYVPTLYSDNALLQCLLPELKDLKPRSCGFGRRVEQLVRSGRQTVVITDSFSYLPDSLMLSAGYQPARTFTLRIGRHRIVVTCWCSHRSDLSGSVSRQARAATVGHP